MPEDNSDDSSIPDCCRSKQVAIRKKYLWHYDYQRSWLRSNLCSFGTELNFNTVQLSRFIEIANAKSADFCMVLLRLLPTLEVRLNRSRTLKLFEVFYVLRDDLNNTQHRFLSLLGCLQFLYAASGLDHLKPYAGLKLVRAYSSQQLCHRFLQQKF
ncbi:hypothetical protein [Pseudochrobactrum sp. MP213Fo]|uniref:hypothetical protein n=1 Tax=Pseudochrobactrum sp. MP213Fo TaxID=3022250 RepID=UPI003BA2C651